MIEPEMQLARAAMEQAPTERTWQIPGYHDKGPVNIAMRLPEVTITDSDGRYITVSPSQAGILSAQLDSIHCWYASNELEPHEY